MGLITIADYLKQWMGAAVVNPMAKAGNAINRPLLGRVNEDA